MIDNFRPNSVDSQINSNFITLFIRNSYCNGIIERFFSDHAF